MSGLDKPIPVLRPRLPTADRLLPYLRRIDDARIYSNWGPLATELSARLANGWGIPQGAVVTASCGMAALVAAIYAIAGPAVSNPRKRALLPDFTFTASGLAAQLCGYQPLLTSSSRASWAIEPDALLARPEALDGVAFVMPVAPFGRVTDTGAWQAFQDLTGIPVIVDAAASFEAVDDARLRAAAVPFVLSFHATKTFGCGEGGCLLTTDTKLAERVAQCLNFGFSGSRDSAMASLNGKMSEYHAAVALAELDGWADKKAQFDEVVDAYRRTFEEAGLGASLTTSPDVASCYVLFDCGEAALAHKVACALDGMRIQSRFWYGSGLSGHQVFADALRTDLHGGAGLDPLSLVGLPMSVDLAHVDIERVCAAVRAVLGVAGS